MASVQLRAIRNGLVAAVATAVVGFTLNALFSSGGSRTADGSASPSRAPSCRPRAVPLEREALRGVSGRFLDVWMNAPDDGWAVGTSGDTSTSATAVVARWDGGAWTNADVPETAAVDVLEGVDGSSASDVWAVGWAGDGFGARDTLAVHFDGVSWNLSSTPTDAALFAVAALGADDVWAVGSIGNPELGDERALALHWDGSTWLPAPLPVGGGRSGLLAVDGSPGDLWAVGYHHLGPLLLHFDGTTWERTLELDARGPLNAVSVADDEVWIAGSSVLRGDGSSFAQVRAAPKGGSFSDVLGLSSDAAWAVGSITTASASRSLAVRIDGSHARAARVRASGDDALEAVAGLDDEWWVAGWHEGAKGVVPLVATLTGCASAGDG